MHNNKAQNDFRPHVIVKFIDDIRLSREGMVEFDKVEPGLWEDIVREFPDIIIEKLFTSVDTSRIKKLQLKARRRIKKLQLKARERDDAHQLPNLLSYFVIYTPPDVDPQSLVEKLSSLDIIERVHVGLEYEEPSSVNPGNNPRYHTQGYLGQAPEGIDAEFAWTIAGGGGTGQRLIDLERGWTEDHEDLVSQNCNLIQPATVVNSSRGHGTGVLGIICASDNDKGVIGIVPCISSVGMVSWHGRLIADAIVDAIDNLAFGDTLLLEVQINQKDALGPGQDGPLHHFPIEADPSTSNFAAIRLATALGIVVIECAGNGGKDLDSDPLHPREQPVPGKRRRQSFGWSQRVTVWLH